MQQTTDGWRLMCVKEGTLHAANNGRLDVVITKILAVKSCVFSGITGNGTISWMQYIRASPPLEDTYGLQFLVKSTHRNPEARIHLKAKNAQTIFNGPRCTKRKMFLLPVLHGTQKREEK